MHPVGLFGGMMPGCCVIDGYLTVSVPVIDAIGWTEQMKV